jgi:hypothetical protein
MFLTDGSGFRAKLWKVRNKSRPITATMYYELSLRIPRKIAVTILPKLLSGLRHLRFGIGGRAKQALRDRLQQSSLDTLEKETGLSIFPSVVFSPLKTSCLLSRQVQNPSRNVLTPSMQEGACVYRRQNAPSPFDEPLRNDLATG